MLSTPMFFQKQSSSAGRQEKTKGDNFIFKYKRVLQKCIFQEFFERKRLQNKVKKVVRPRSPQERSSRAISRDLLFLQAVSKAHDGSTGSKISQVYTHTRPMNTDSQTS